MPYVNVEPISDTIVITDNAGVKVAIPKNYLNIHVPVAGNDIYLETIGISYTVDYTTLTYPVTGTKAELAEIIDSWL